jgi:hypothetical protein
MPITYFEGIKHTEIREGYQQYCQGLHWALEGMGLGTRIGDQEKTYSGSQIQGIKRGALCRSMSPNFNVPNINVLHVNGSLLQP